MFTGYFCYAAFTMKVLIYLYLLLSLATSCQPKQNMIYMSNHHFEDEVSQARYTGLRIKSADMLEVKVSAFDDIAVKPFNLSSQSGTNSVSMTESSGGGNGSSQLMVSSEGYITMPVLGRVYCLGMTKHELEQDLEERLKPYLTDPRVDVRLTNFNISVLGDVSSPGQKTTNNERLNLFQALALAGDMTPSADRTQVKLVRYSEQTQKDTVVNLDLSDAGIVNSPYYYLQQNDILYVQPDKNAQIVANTTNPNRSLFIQLLSAGLAAVALIITFVR